METYRAVEEIRTEVRAMNDDIAKLKMALVKSLPEDEREEVFTMEKFSGPEEFEEFCEKLKNRNFKKLVVRIMLVIPLYIEK